MARFKSLSITSKPGHQNCVIMGRKTYTSIPPKYRPLSGRLNIVVTTNKDFHSCYDAPSTVLIAGSLDEALNVAYKQDHTIPVDKVFVIGGASLLCESVEHPQCEYVYYTTVFNDVECDVFITPTPDTFDQKNETEVIEQNGYQFQFSTFVRRV